MPKGSIGTSMGGTIEYTRMKGKKKLNEWEKPIPKKGLCLNCGYYYQATCTFDGTKNPAKSECENFVSLRMRKTNNTKKKKAGRKKKLR